MQVQLEMFYFRDHIQSDLLFVEMLLSEESVFVLPGKIFNVDNFIRIVLTLPTELLIEACNRLTKFCLAHSNGQVSNGNFESRNTVSALHANLRESVAVD